MADADINQTERKLAVAVVTMAIVITACFAGCREGPSEPLPETFPVTGTVVYQGGEPLTYGMVEFQSLDDPTRSASGEIQPNGRFTLTTFAVDQRVDGTVAGQHRAVVFASKPEQHDSQPITLREVFTVARQPNEFRLQLEHAAP